jgi:hypothetical protein
MLRPLIPAALAVFLVAGGCVASGEDRATKPKVTSTATADHDEPLSSGQAAGAVRAKLRDDRRGPVESIDCSQHEGRGRVLCNVEFRSTCDVYLAVRDSSGKVAMQRPDHLTICTFTTVTVQD